MPTPANPSAPTPAGDSRQVTPTDGVVITPSFEDRLQLFWEKNSKVVTVVLLLILLGIVAKGGWEYLQAQKEAKIGQAFAAATTTPQLKAFAAENAGHTLAGAAQLRIADEAYGEGKYADAIAPYEQAAAGLKTGPLASRARLGAAMSKLQGGRAADGEAALKAFAADEKEITAYRAEATYHLASFALSNSKLEDVNAYSDQLMKIDPASPWTQRAMQLRVRAGS